MNKESAGLLMFRRTGGEVEVLLVHPGGPFWAKKDSGAWTVPKGEVEEGGEALDAARREFAEETGYEPAAPFLPLGTVRQKAGKRVTAWAFTGNLEPARIRGPEAEIEWPPRSGKWIRFPEIDRADFFRLPAAREKINPAQVAFLDALERLAP